MMNHMPAGPGQPSHISPALPRIQQSRRQQDYHSYHSGPPQSPMHPHAYANYHPQYYTHPVQPQYAQHHWQHQSPYMQPMYMPMQQMQPVYRTGYPTVVTSQPHPQPTHQAPRHPAPSHSQHNIPTSRQTSQHVPQNNQAAAPPSPAPTPKKEHESSPSVSTVSSRRDSSAVNHAPVVAETKPPFYPQLPWYSPSAGPEDFPPRATPRRKLRHNTNKSHESVALPVRDADESGEGLGTATEEQASEESTLAAPSDLETPATSQAPSESEFISIIHGADSSSIDESSPMSVSKQHEKQQHARKDTRTAIAVPHLPSTPKRKANAASEVEKKETTATETAIPAANHDLDIHATAHESETEELQEEAAKVKVAPKSWAELVRVRTNNISMSAMPAVSGSSSDAAALSKSASLAEALKKYDVQQNAFVSFLEPRGLVNTGNMCYMNSILQVLVFCSPFYSFLEQVRQRTVHSMKSETPLLDAMIMFLREFKVLGSADSAQNLARKLKPAQLEQYGEPVTPEYVYDAIRKLPRFQTMRRGHQQDAEEFLGFLLEGLHDECVHVMAGQARIASNGYVEDATEAEAPTSSADGWLEVGPKQKAAVTRTAGSQDTPSPIDKIFGGHLRSELRVSGLKDSVTLEPYKPLQLDIGAPNVNNIIDALKGLTRAEALTGEFGGRNNTAKKQVFIDTLPPVLILHLKRFQYDSSFSGTQKIWKKVGYPLELELPKEVFAPSKRGSFAVQGGLPKYRLTSVVYHHGKSAAGGHYTVDVLRQDSRDWVRMDDTHIRRIRPEEVAEGGAEEDPKILAKALEQHKADEDLRKQRNMYEGLDQADDDVEDERPWSEVNGHPNGANKKWAAIVNTNGTATPTGTTGKQTPNMRREGIKDNKVAYILLYERVRD